MAQALGVGAEHQPRTITVYSSAARTATPLAVEFSPRGAVGIMARLDATAAAATPSIVMSIEAWDPAAGAWFQILADAAVTGVATSTLVVDPRETAAANSIARHALFERMRILVTHADADSITYSVSLTAYK